MDVFVLEPQNVGRSNLIVQPGVLYSFWGQRSNVLNTIPIMVGQMKPTMQTLQGWSTSGDLFVSNSSFLVDVSGFTVNGCQVNELSFRGENVDLAFEGTELRGVLADESAPGVIEFIGFVPNTCSVLNYPTRSSIMVVKVPQPTYTLTSKSGGEGCAAVHVAFDSPAMALGEDVLVISPSTIAVETKDFSMDPNGLFMDVNLCITQDSASLLVSLNHDVVTSISGAAVMQQEPVEVYISRIAMVLSLSQSGLTVVQNKTYIFSNEAVQLDFQLESDMQIGRCDFSNVFTSDRNVDLTVSKYTGGVLVKVCNYTIDHHVIEIHPERAVCNGAFSVEFTESQVKFAYDPAFLPGDIVFLRVNSYYSPEFDFMPLRKVYTWDKVFFTDSGWVNDLIGFMDHGTDGCISWTPKKDTEAGTVVSWSYVEMTQHLDRSIPANVTNDYSFNYEMHGFLLDFQDNLFAYTTGDHLSDSQYDDYGHIQFIFGLYWSSSEWATPSNYMDITAEYSALPSSLLGYAVAVGISNDPVPRGVNYMSIDEYKFTRFPLTALHIIERVTNVTYWLTSQKDRFTIAPKVFYVQYPMDYTASVEILESTVNICFDFNIRYTAEYDFTKIHVTAGDSALPVDKLFKDTLQCIEFPRPTDVNEVKVYLEYGALTYTTTTTQVPFSYFMRAYSTVLYFFNDPTLTTSFDSSKRLQVITVESSIPCVEWGSPEESSMQAYLVSQSPSTTTLALRALSVPATLVLGAGYCKTSGETLSARFESEPVTVESESVEATLLRDVHLLDMKTNTLGSKTILLRAPAADWTLNESVVEAGSSVALSGEETVQLTFELTGEAMQSVAVPAGLFVKNQYRSSSAKLSLEEVYRTYPEGGIDVKQFVDLPWEEPVTGESVREATFHSDFVPTMGSGSPLELMFFRDACRPLGYVLGSSASISVAIMDGLCHYGAEAEKVVDSYGNTNLGFNDTKEFDFVAPVGRLVFVEEGTTEFPEELRQSWNHAPVVSIFFDEPLYNFNESISLITVEGCDAAFLSHLVLNDASIVSYKLSNCLEGTVTVELVENVLLSDDFGNEVLSQDSISVLLQSVEMDYTRPQITLSMESSNLYTSTIDIQFSISEPDTLFTCNSIGIAIQEVSVSLSQVNDHTCRYEFDPKPVNGSYIIFFVPEGRFTDRAGNPNFVSNTLTPLALNEGARITVDAPRFTSQVQNTFTLSIDYVWLCPSYEYVFPSIFEYDHDVARIEKISDSVDEKGTILETFTITFFNFETYPEDRYKNMTIHIPAMACINSAGLYNEATQFQIYFDNTPTVPMFELTPKMEAEDNFLIEVSFSDMAAFGAEDPARYFLLQFEGGQPLTTCEFTRNQTENVFTYLGVCPLTQEGNLNVTILEGAAIELTGLPSATFSRVIYVDGYPPTITLSAVGSTLFGPSVTRLQMYMNVSELMGQFNNSCFELVGAENLEVSFATSGESLTSNQIVDVTAYNRNMRASMLSGTFVVFVKEHCMMDVHNNYNEKSNEMVFSYDFVSPTVRLNCPAQNTVLNTVTLSGTLSEPCQPLSAANFAIPETCVVQDIAMESDTEFAAKISCSSNGTFEFSVKSVVDLVGNAGGASNACSARFTINGPYLAYSIHNLLEDMYVNTQEFSIDVWTVTDCAEMDLTVPGLILTENANITLAKANSLCNWTITGRSLQEGNVAIRILEGAAHDGYGGLSYSILIGFYSYQSTPSIISITPTLFAANTQNDVTLCYDWDIIRGDGGVDATLGCSNVVVKSSTSQCVVLTVDITTGSRCYLYLHENFVRTRWQLPSPARYVFLEIDETFPAIDTTVTVGDRVSSVQIDTAEPSQREAFVNGDAQLSIAVPAGVAMAVEKLTWASTCSAAVTQVQNERSVDVSVAWNVAEDCALTLEFAEGFFVDSLGRASSLARLAVRYSRAAPEASVAAEAYVAAVPVTACVTFSHPVAFSLSNVDSLTTATLNSTESCANLLMFYPAGSGVVAFSLQNVVDAYGNAMETYERYEIVFYAEQPEMQPVSPVITTTLNGATAFSVELVFNHRMADVPDTVEELFVLNATSGVEGVALSQLLAVQSATVQGDTVTITMIPVLLSSSFRCVLSLSPIAFADLAGNTVRSGASFEVVVDNEPPQIQSVTVQGGTAFSKLPVAITLTFNKQASLSADFATFVTGSLGGNAIRFVMQQESQPSEEGFFVESVHLLSDTLVQFAPGDELAVVVAAGALTATNGLQNAASRAFVLVATDGVLRVSASPEIPAGRPNVVVLEFSQPVVSIVESKISGVNAALAQVEISGHTVELTFAIAQQGEWSVSLAAGAVIGSDESTTAEAIEVSGFYDTVAPMVSCEVPSVISVGEVSLRCWFSEPVEPVEPDTLFEITHDGVVLSHAEELSGDRTNVTLRFTAMEERVENYLGAVLVTLKSCRDAHGNACLPVRYVVTIDMVPPKMTLEATQRYLHDNETITVFGTFDKAVQGVEASQLQIDYDDQSATVVMESFAVLEEGKQYSWTLTFSLVELYESIVQFTLVYPQGAVYDHYGNPNAESSLVVSINELAPNMTVRVLSSEESLVRLALSVQNGPISHLTSSMWTATESVSVVSVEAQEVDIVMEYVMTISLSCATSCEWSIRFLSEMIFNDAGNKMEHDVTFSSVYVMQPVVTLSVTDLYCSSALCRFELLSSEPTDLSCSKVAVSSADYRVVEQSYLNAVRCPCQIQYLHATTALNEVRLEVPAGVIANKYGSTNDAVGPVSFFHNMQPSKPVFQSNWTAEAPILDIAVTLVIPNLTYVLPSAQDFRSEMLHCTNCDIANFRYRADSQDYAFEVSFVSDTDRYARVFVEEGAFTDLFGLRSAASELILRKDDVKPEVMQLVYHPDSKMSVEMYFSTAVHSCGGVVTFTPEGYPNDVLSLLTTDARVRFMDRFVYFSVPLLSSASYVVAWEAEAFCDDTNMPSSTDFASPRFTTSSGIPMPPTRVEVLAVTATTATVAYSGAAAGGDAIRSVIAVLVPSARLAPAENTTARESGELTLSALEPDTLYQLSLVARNSLGYSLPSAPVQFRTLPWTPEPISDLRICKLNDPVTTSAQLIVYSEATACWTASRSHNVTYRVLVSELRNNEVVSTAEQGETTETSATVTVANSASSYRVTVRACASQEIEGGARCSEVSRDFVTTIDLEDVERFPQGAGIKLVVERRSREEMRVGFTHPLENYFPIEKYTLHYGNVFDDECPISGSVLESCPIRMEYCTSSSITVTVRATVNGDFSGLPSNRVTVFCGQPRLSIQARPGYDFVAFFVTSEFHTTATCTIRPRFDAEILGSQEVVVDPVNSPPAYLFKSLDPDAEYIIDCQGFDVQFAPISGSVMFSTFNDFALPSMLLAEPAVAEVGATFARVAVEAVNMPGNVYCLAFPQDGADGAASAAPVWPSRAQFAKKGCGSYVFPEMRAMSVLLTELRPATAYTARCIFDPDFDASRTVLGRRLAEEESFNFTTAAVDSPQWAAFAPSGSVQVFVNSAITLTGVLPVVPYIGALTLACPLHPEETQVLRPNNTRFSVLGNSVSVAPLRPLRPGFEYTVETSLGLFLDAFSHFPLPAVLPSDKFAFVVTNDTLLTAAPALLDSMPKEGAESQQASLEVTFTFDRPVVAGAGFYKVIVDGGAPLFLPASELLVSNNMVVAARGVFYPEDSAVQVVLPEGSLCSTFGVCLAAPVTLSFTVRSLETAPQLMSVFPANGQQHVPAGEDLVLVFNKQIRLADDFVFVLTDETTRNVTLHYARERSKVSPRLLVDANRVVVRGSAIPAGHSYTVRFRAEDYKDGQGNSALNMPENYAFSVSQYPCSGGYIFEDMGSECSCFLTNSKCECWCGEPENPMDVVIRLAL